MLSKVRNFNQFRNLRELNNVVLIVIFFNEMLQFDQHVVIVSHEKTKKYKRDVIVYKESIHDDYLFI